jgi:hypothetical protein
MPTWRPRGRRDDGSFYQDKIGRNVGSPHGWA